MQIVYKDLKFKDTQNLVEAKLKLIILHHAAGEGFTVEQIHQMHRKQGWAGIGYHFYIRKDGQIYAGRPENKVGAHCVNNNSCSLGICLEGNFTKTKPTPEQIKSLKELVAELKKRHKNIYKILNHRDLMATACPGVDLKEMIK